MNRHIDDMAGGFCYKDQCNTIIAVVEVLGPRRVNPEAWIVGPFRAPPEAGVPRIRNRLGHRVARLSGA